MEFFIDPGRIEYSMDHKLGEGTFGIVVAGRLKEAGSSRAVRAAVMKPGYVHA